MPSVSDLPRHDESLPPNLSERDISRAADGLRPSPEISAWEAVDNLFSLSATPELDRLCQTFKLKACEAFAQLMVDEGIAASFIAAVEFPRKNGGEAAAKMLGMALMEVAKKMKLCE